MDHKYGCFPGQLRLTENLGEVRRLRETPDFFPKFDPSGPFQEHVGYGFVVVVAAAVGQLSSSNVV